MKICYLISSHGLGGKGGGGHFYSLKTTAEAVKEKCDCVVADIGVNESPVIKSANVKSYHIRFMGLNVVNAMRSLNKIMVQEKPNVLHAFDTDSYFFARLVGFMYKKPSILTNCLSVGPPRFYPYADHLIFYSAENKRYFEQMRKYKRAGLHLIPNRASRVKTDFQRINNIRAYVDNNSKVFLRIVRFSRTYKADMIQSINLVNRLNKIGYPCQLVFIGALQNKEVFDEIAQFQSERIKLFHSDEYTINASELIDIADFVIGTARGFMEAASLGKILLTPSKNGKYPLLVTEESFHEAFDLNFFPLNRLKSYDEEENYKNIVRALSEESFSAILKRQSGLWFEQYFNIDNVVDTYCDIYRSLTYDTKHCPIDFLLNMIACFKHFLRS